MNEYKMTITFKDKAQSKAYYKIPAADFLQAWSKALGIHLRHIQLEDVDGFSIVNAGPVNKEKVRA